MDIIIHSLSCLSSWKKTNFSNLLSYTYINNVFVHNYLVHLVLIKLEPAAEDSVHNTQNFLLHSLLFQHPLKYMEYYGHSTWKYWSDYNIF